VLVWPPARALSQYSNREPLAATVFEVVADAAPVEPLRLDRGQLTPPSVRLLEPRTTEGKRNADVLIIKIAKALAKSSSCCEVAARSVEELVNPN